MRKAATVCGAVALVLVITTGAFAAKNLITGADIKDGSITGADIRTGSLGASDLSAAARSSLRGQDGTRGPAGPAGQAGAAGPAGPAGAVGAKGNTGDKGATGSAGPAGGKGDKGDKGDSAFGSFGPYALDHEDSGSCDGPAGTSHGEFWADDLGSRHYVIQARPDGWFNVTQYNVGTFTAQVGTHYPGNKSDGDATTTCVEGESEFATAVQGTWSGYQTVAVDTSTGTGGFNPAATCAGECGLDAFVAAVFGTTAYDYAAYEFNYRSSCGGHWRDKQVYVGPGDSVQTGNITDC